MDGMRIGIEGFYAPAQHWRLFLRSTLLALLTIGAVFLAAGLLDWLGVEVRSTEVQLRIVASTTMWISLLTFEWSWLRAIRDPEISWRNHLLRFGLPFCVFGTLSFLLTNSITAASWFHNYLLSFDPVINQVGHRLIHAPSWRTAVLYYSTFGLIVWLRLRLLPWSIDVLITGRLRWPMHIWIMTQGHVWELMGMVITISLAVSVVATPLLCLAYLFFGNNGLAVVGIIAIAYLFAALDHAYLASYTQMKSERSVIAAVTAD